MKVKASFTISRDTIAALDRIVGRNGNRSSFVDEALRQALQLRERAEREAKDAAIFKAHFREIDREIRDSQELLYALRREDIRRTSKRRRRRSP
jgi:metal-responsive CopG/Arc/MetJ family transcriptional regulator